LPIADFNQKDEENERILVILSDFLRIFTFFCDFVRVLSPRNIFRKTENTARGLRKAARFFVIFRFFL